VVRPTQSATFKQRLDFKKNLDFPEEEYHNRILRFQNELTMRAIDVCIVTIETNVRYFTGFKNSMWIPGGDHPMMAILPSDGEPILFVPEFLEGAALSSSWIEDVRFPKRGRGYGDVLRCAIDALQERSLLGGTAGLELGWGERIHLSRPRLEMLDEALSGTETVDAMEPIHAVRNIKSTREVEMLRTAYEITWAAYEEARRRMYAGMPEQELFNVISAAMSAAGSERNFIAISSAASGYSVADGLPSTHPIEAGTMFWLDCGACYHGYWADFVRQGVLGKPTNEQRRWLDASVRANVAAASAVRAGAATVAPIAAADASLARDGLAEYRIGDLIGHGLGMSLHEPPYLSENSFGVTKDQRFEPGMVINIEVSLSDPGDWSFGRYAVEDTYLVGADGTEWLTPADMEAWII
jgi:Xaa-Pro aminopeptidase